MPYAPSTRDQSRDSVRPLRILLVEDDAVISTLVAEVLASMGHAVIGIEATEAGAVAAAQRERPELMIVDDMLSLGSGLSAVRRILHDGFIPHVFISGDAARVQKLAPHALVVEKPFYERQLSQAMSRALQQADQSV